MNKCEAKDTDFRSVFYKNLPHKPYCMYEKPGYMLIRTKAIAVKQPYLQINPPLMTFYFVFDDDKDDAALSWFDAGLPKIHYIRNGARPSGLIEPTRLIILLTLLTYRRNCLRSSKLSD